MKITSRRVKPMHDHTRFCKIVYWKALTDVTGAHASDATGAHISSGPDEDWTRVDIQPLSSYSSYGTHSFGRTPADEYARGKLLSLLKQAYEAGRRDKLREIQQILGIT